MQDEHSLLYREIVGRSAGTCYNPLELNGFKLTNETLVEFLDIGKDYSINSLVQAVSTPREMRFLADRECSGKLRWEGDTKLW